MVRTEASRHLHRVDNQLEHNTIMKSATTQTERELRDEQDSAISAEVAARVATSRTKFATNSASIINRKPTNSWQDKGHQHYISTQDEDDCVSEWEASEFDEEEEDENFGFEALFAAPEIDLPIAREGITINDLETPTAVEFAQAQSEDSDLQLVRDWILQGKTPSADEVAKFGSRLKEFAQILDQIHLREEVLVLRSEENATEERIIVPVALVERVIRNLHEGFGAAHQAAKATTARLIRRFFWPGLKRDVRLYVACCPVCEEFLHSTRSPKAGLHPMDVGGRGDCLAMDIVGGGESLPLTARGSKYILTLVDCFTRYAFAIPLNDQSSEAVVNAVIGNYITVHGTPRRILTDQGKCFESALFLSFCKFFRISKIRTSGYRPQSNGICERFNQTLKRSLCKSLSKSLQPSWDLYLNFVTFSYNTSIHSSTGFSPHYLTFGCEARLPADLVFGTPEPTSFNPSDGFETSGSLSSLFKSFSVLNSSFSVARENLGLVHQREKDRYDLGAVERVFQPGDVVRIRFKSRKPGPSKFNSGWSGAHEVLGTQGVLVTVKEKSTGRVYKMHHDRLSNPVFTRKFEPKFSEGSNPSPEGSDSNPQENPKEPEEDSEPVADPQLALQRSRYGRVVKPNRDPAFDYSSFLLSSRESSFEPSVSEFCFMFTSAPTAHANPDSQPPTAVQEVWARLSRDCAANWCDLANEFSTWTRQRVRSGW